MGSNLLTNLQVYGATNAEIPPTRTLLVGHDVQLQRSEQQVLQRIVILGNYYAFQQQRPLRFSIRCERTG